MATLNIQSLVDHSTFDANGKPGLTYRTIRGPRVALEWFARRFLVPRDGLPWALGVGIDIPALINATPSPTQLVKWRSAFDAEGSRSEFVARVTSSLTFETETLHYSPHVTLVGAGTYPLAIRIDKAGDILATFPIL